MRYDQTSEALDDLDEPPPIERRDWREPDPDRLRELQDKQRRTVRMASIEAGELADLLAGATVRRDLLALRRRVEGWAIDWIANHGEDPGRGEDGDAIIIMRDIVTALDERLSDRGAIERGTR